MRPTGVEIPRAGLGLFFLFIMPLLFSCSDQYNMGSHKPEKQNPKKIKMHTKNSPGVWPQHADSHTPVIERDPDKPQEIMVTIPFKGTKNPLHYIETIILLQGKKEIQKKTFTFSFEPAKAKFLLPDPKAKDYSVLTKCNTHGMWIAPVPSRFKKSPK